MKKSKRILAFLIAVVTMVSLSTNAFAWYDGAHQGFVTDYWTSSDNYGELDAFLLGSTFADIQAKDGSPFPYSYPKGKGSLHGDLWSKGKIDSGECNYVACYTYLTKVACYMGNLTNVKVGTVSKVTGMTNNDFEALKGYVTFYKDTDGKWKGTIGGHNFNTVFSYYGLRNNSYTRKAFVYGLALHAATDVLAHSTWEKNGSTWTRITHPEADSIIYNRTSGNTYSHRYYAAQQVARNVLTSYARGGEGRADDLYVNELFTTYGNFLLGNFQKYAKAAGATLDFSVSDLKSKTGIEPK